MLIDAKILDVIACPICKGKLYYDKNANRLICKFNKLAFSIENGVPIMLVEHAKPFDQDSK